MKVATLEYSALGVRVNALCPGRIETPMVIERGVEAGTHPEAYWQLAELHPIGLLGKPEEIAEAAGGGKGVTRHENGGVRAQPDGGYVAQ